MEFVKGIRSRRVLFNERLNEIVDAIVRYRKAEMAIPTDWITEYNTIVECIRNKHKKYTMNFGQALEALKQGRKVSRKGWNGKGIFIELQFPDKHSKMSSPYLFIDTTGLQSDNVDAPRSRVPWLASQTDVLAEDWVELD